jgi:hypothetical protein
MTAILDQSRFIRVLPAIEYPIFADGCRIQIQFPVAFQVLARVAFDQYPAEEIKIVKEGTAT